MKKLSTIGVLLLAISSQACANETEPLPATEEENTSSATAAEVVTPRDPATGLPTGQRMHKPLVIVKAPPPPPPPPQ